MRCQLCNSEGTLFVVERRTGSGINREHLCGSCFPSDKPEIVSIKAGSLISGLAGSKRRRNT